MGKRTGPCVVARAVHCVRQSWYCVLASVYGVEMLTMIAGVVPVSRNGHWLHRSSQAVCTRLRGIVLISRPRQVEKESLLRPMAWGTNLNGRSTRKSGIMSMFCPPW